MERGRKLYHEVGCVACHEADPKFETPTPVPSPIDALIEQLEPEELEDMGLASAARRVESIPHGQLGAKYSARALTMMLWDPASVRPDARMPSLRLQPLDAADIAAYLMRDQTIEPDIENETTGSNEIEAGRQLFRELRCANCHDTEANIATTMARPLASLNLNASASCLHRPLPQMPAYRLDEEQLQAVTARLRDHDETVPPSDDAFVQHRMRQLNCYACHERTRTEDGNVLGGVGRFRRPYFETEGHIDLGDEGRLPPPLTGVGRKLLPAALETVFSVKAAPRRPFMKIRMPTYHNDAVADLIQRLPAADQVDFATQQEVFGDADDTAEIGRELVNTGCVECHAFRGENLPGAIGVDLHDVSSRLWPQWFEDFIRHPGEVKKRTRMPTFFPEGQSNRKDLLDGDVSRQIAAIWHYLKKSEPLPQKLIEARSKDFELVPADRPILLRTFMPGAGNHAIAVGLPGGLNFAFDGEHSRLAIAWKGRFLDAHSTWFERFAPPADPLGESVVKFPSVPPLFCSQESSIALNDKSDESGSHFDFGGYRLDPSGYPTFLYRFGPWDIEDRIQSVDREVLLRTFTIRRSDRPSEDDCDGAISFRAHVAKQLQRGGPTSVRDDSGLSVSVQYDMQQEGEVMDTGPLQQWLFRLEDKNEHVIKMEYRW